ncbi:MAG: putative nicotinate phosphoribosyltransferase [Candidatus Thorarchaeota archaeon]|nr:MAG: putative nicotinate phosphoribosyltransferase [Candidatus Thorarchaeota archaeon]
MRRKWRIATEEEILDGKTTDVYFKRTEEVLRREGVNPLVYAEITVSGMPEGLDWGVSAGIDDVITLFQDKNVDLYGLREGRVFSPRAKSGVKIPVLQIVGHYADFAVLETPLLGFMCHTSGMVSKTARIRKACGDRTLLSFGARRTHPAITPQVEYAAYIGGCDGVSCILGAELLDMDASGTMPHALIIAFQDQVKAWTAFDKDLPDDIPRIALADTYLDEVVESIMAAENISKLTGVRLDTPGSRKGDFKRIIQEVRWELDIRGFTDVKLFISGGLDAEKISELGDTPIAGFGVGGAISNSPAIDFAMDVVAIHTDGEWKPAAKRGKFSGRKIVWQCPQCLEMSVTQWNADIPTCYCGAGKMQKATELLLEKGSRLKPQSTPTDIRTYVLEQVSRLKIS